jgi:glucokinase
MSDARLGIGVDVGGTFTKLGVVDEHGSIVTQHQVQTPAERGPDAILASVAAGVAALLDAHGDRIASVGLGVPGVINDRGEIAYPPNLPGWQIVPVAERLRPLLPRSLAIAVENDANVAAFAESRAGSGSRDASFLFITLGTGIGGCVIVDRSIWRGGGGGAGEVGHVSVDANGPLCGCGSRGCIEAYLGQRSMIALARERVAREHSSSLHALVASGEELTPKHLTVAADAGDRVAIELFDELGTLLGVALASVLNLCDLALVIVGGGVARAGEHILEPARRSLRARALKSIAARIEVRPAIFGNDAGMVGAALLGLQQAKHETDPKH